MNRFLLSPLYHVLLCGFALGAGAPLRAQAVGAGGQALAPSMGAPPSYDWSRYFADGPGPFAAGDPGVGTEFRPGSFAEAGSAGEPSLHAGGAGSARFHRMGSGAGPAASPYDLGSSLLRSMAAASGAGPLGSSIVAFSRMTSRSGYTLAGDAASTTRLDLHLSPGGEFGMGGRGAGGAMGFAPTGLGSSFTGIPRAAGSGRGSGPGMSLQLKF